RVILAGLTHGVAIDSIIQKREMGALYIAFESVPFSLLVIHFLYRYWSVRRPHLIALFTKKSFIALLLSGTSFVIITWYLICFYGTVGEEDSEGRRALIAEYENTYGKRIEGGWMLLDHWSNDELNVRILITVIIMNVIMFSSVALASSLAFLTFHHIRSSQKLSVQAGLLQRKLLIALCAQAAVPSLFVYTPYMLTIDMPFMRLPVPIVHDLSVPLTTCFPVCDSAILILLISDYRRGLLGMIRKNQVREASSAMRVSTVAS
ncbi:hypothetical protein PENTCL1PPCAC_25768, partial [Pristionchus entomophagus]